MAKSSYPDSLCMVGRVGHYEEAINGVYTRMQKEAKKTDVRLFYEKGDGVLLCYGAKAWADSEQTSEKPTKGWMIGWYQEQGAGESKERRLFIAARCPIADPSSSAFLWEVRNEEGDFTQDASTQLVLLPEKDAAKPAAERVTLRLADEVGLHPEDAGGKVALNLDNELAASPMAAMASAGMPSPFGGMSPFAGMMGGFFPPADQWPAQQKKGKKKKGKASPAAGGLRAEAKEFVPGAMPPAAAYPGGYPGMPMFPFMPGMFPPGMPGMPDMSRIAQRAQQPMVSINAKYMTEEDHAKPPPEPPAPVVKDGLTATQTTVEWKVGAVKEQLLACGKTQGVQSPSFAFKLDGVSGPDMNLMFYPFGHTMSPAGCVAVSLECAAGARMKFKLHCGAQKSGSKVLMGNRFHVDFAGSSVFKTEEDAKDEGNVLRFDDLEIGIELLGWI